MKDYSRKTDRNKELSIREPDSDNSEELSPLHELGENYVQLW